MLSWRIPKNRSDNLAAPDTPAKAYTKTAWRRSLSGAAKTAIRVIQEPFGSGWRFV